MLSFWKKNAGQHAENPWFFKKFRFQCFLPSPCLQTSSIPPWEKLKWLLQTLQYACCLPRSLAITQSNVLVCSALKFDSFLYLILFFAGLIPGDDSRSSSCLRINSQGWDTQKLLVKGIIFLSTYTFKIYKWRFAIFVGFIKLYSRLDYLYLYYLVYIQALNWYRFFSDFEMLYLTAIRNYQASLRYQNIDHCRKQAAPMARWGIVRSRENAILIFLGDFCQIITRNDLKKNSKTMSGVLKIRDFLKKSVLRGRVFR